MRTSERGQVLVIVALAFAVFLGFAALAVDVAYMYSVRNELQRCADAGALAGASAFVDNTIPSGGENAEAMTRVINIVPLNTVAGSPLNPATDVLVQLPPVTSENTVRVTTDCTVNLFFARIWPGRDTTAIRATAAASHLPSDNTLRLME